MTAPAMTSPRCPRCKTSIGYKTEDDDTFGCYIHGELSVATPLPLLYAKPSARCPDCNTGVSNAGSRCKSCASKARTVNRKQTTHRGQGIVIRQSLVPPAAIAPFPSRKRL